MIEDRSAGQAFHHEGDRLVKSRHLCWIEASFQPAYLGSHM